MKRFAAGFLIFIFFAAHTASAAVFRNDTDVRIEPDEVINESLYVSGSNIEIEGTVDGDVFCAAQNVTITGTVTGDIICGAQTIRFEGTAEGDLRLAAQQIVMSGKSGSNGTFFAQQIDMDKSASVAGELLTAGQQVNIEGTVGKHLTAGGQTVRMNGTVAHNARLYGQKFSLGDDATINGDLTYTSEDHADISDTASIAGIIKQEAPEKMEGRETSGDRVRKAAWGAKLASIVLYIILSLVFISLMPVRLKHTLHTMRTSPGITAAIGFLILIVTPIVMVLFFITIIGLPFGLVILFVYIIALMLSRIFAAILLGKILLEKFWHKKRESLYWAAFIGIPVSWILFNLPYVGSLLTFIGLILGLGAEYYLIRPKKTTS